MLFEVCAFVCSHISSSYPYQRLRSRHPYLKLPTPYLLDSATEVVKHTHTNTQAGKGWEKHTHSIISSFKTKIV